MLYAGIDIGGTAVKMGVLDGDTGRLIYTARAETGKLSPENMADAIAALFAETADAMQREYGQPIAGVGAVSAGRVQPATGYVTAGNLDWWDVPFGPMLAQRIGMPVAIDNDVQGALYGEWKGGICRDVENVVYISLGTGIGGAFLINGALFRGLNHEGAEIGHMVTHADGESCTCGGHGCWEAYASATALSRMAGGKEPKEVFDLAAAGNSAMQDVLSRYIHELCIGVSSLSSMFRPDMIVIGGGLCEAGDALFAPLCKELAEDAPSIPHGAVPRVKKASLGNQAGMLGAALMARDHSN